MEESMKMADVHMHIVYDVDDGAKNLEESKTMLLAAYDQGVRTVIATPHSFAFFLRQEEIWEHYQMLEEELERSKLNIHLLLGCEVSCRYHRMEKTLEDLESGKLPSMNWTKYVLTEFSNKVSSKDALEMASMLLEKGWIPIIAHVERYGLLFQDDALERLKEMGCLFQINAYSLYDESNEVIKERSRKLLREEMVSFLGSDAHRMNHRPPNVKRGLQYVYKHCSKEYADAVAFGNVEKYLNHT